MLQLNCWLWLSTLFVCGVLQILSNSACVLFKDPERTRSTRVTVLPRYSDLVFAAVP